MSIKTGDIQLAKRSQLIFSKEDYRGIHYGSIRVWLDSPTYKGPTSKGLTLTKDILEDVLEIISKLTKKDIERVRGEKIIAKIPLSNQKELRISLQYYKSRPKLDIREYISSGKFHGFTKKGVSILPESFEDFLRELKNLISELPNSRQEKLFNPKESKPQKEFFQILQQDSNENAPVINRWILLLGLVVFLLITSPVIYLIVRSIGQPPRDLRIDLSNKSNENISKNFKVDECTNCKRLVIRDKNNKVVFDESLENNKENKFREHLVNKANEGDKKNIIKLFNNKFTSRLVDISLDISNSVIYRDEESLRKQSEIKYSDFVFQKLRDYLEGNQGILPRDTINVRFYGPDIKDNPCNNKRVVKYSEPEWDANIIYSQRNKQILIEVGDKLTPKTEENGSEIITNDTEEVYRIIKNFYDEGISNTNADCHFGTYLIPHLTQISDDTNNKSFSNYEFFLVTDGEFYLRDDEITSGKEVYADSKNYDILKNYLNKLNKEFKVNGSGICKNPDDRFIIVGMEYGNNFSYRTTVQQFYGELLKSCKVIFENF